MALFYRPTDGYVGDVIPFYWQGAYHAFYLKAPLEPARHGADGTPYAHVVAHDLVNWDEWPLAIEPGPPGAPDAVSCFTGSVIERDGVFHLFYTGYAGPDVPQTICRATSTDLRHWQKDPNNPLITADARWYEAIDWRDPFPFWNEDAGEYWMLLAAREKDGPSNRRGCIALVTSPDLETWTVQPPFWSPRLYFTHECPDLFRWNDQWVLVYSTFTERHVTHFRVSDNLNGPWTAPANDTFDGRAFYAAKTAGDGEQRYIFGWNPTREGQTDAGRWQWGGHMVIHELRPDLQVKPPESVTNRFNRSHDVTLRPVLGEWSPEAGGYHAAPMDSFAAASLGTLPPTAYLRCTLHIDTPPRGCGLLLRASPDLEAYYQLRWEPLQQRLVFDRWPRPGDEPFVLERPCPATDTLTLEVIVDETVCEAYVNGQVALSTRLYDHQAGEWGLFVAEGQVTFTAIELRTLA
jgi:beta-fructofuranosidase